MHRWEGVRSFGVICGVGDGDATPERDGGGVDIRSPSQVLDHRIRPHESEPFGAGWGGAGASLMKLVKLLMACWRVAAAQCVPLALIMTFIDLVNDGLTWDSVSGELVFTPLTWGIL